MFRKFALTTGLLLAWVTTASADALVTSGDWLKTTGPNTFFADFNTVNGASSSGLQFINNVTSNTFGVAGNTNTVGANLLTSIDPRSGATQAMSYNGQAVVAVFALQGSSNGATGTPPFTFTANNGTVGFYTVAQNTFNKADPSTWGTGSAPIAVFTLTNPQKVTDTGASGTGGPGNQNSPASSTNTQGINVSNSNATQGFYLFKEASATPGGTNATNGLNYMNTVPGPGFNAAIPPGFVYNGKEGIIARADDAYQAADTGSNYQYVSTPAGLALLNTIFANLIGGGAQFGTTGTGTALDYNPSTGPAGALNTNDTIFSLGSTTSPVRFLEPTTPPVPEPATLAVFGLMAGMGGLVYRKRRGTKVVA